MDLDAKKIFKTLNPNKVWLPVIIGLGIVIYMFAQDENYTPDKIRLITEATWWPIALALFVLVARDAGYVTRIRAITNQELSWTSSIYVILLWEFASAVTPSVVGGTAVAVFILWKEGLKLGKALAFVMVTAIFDNLFFVVAAPFALLFGGNEIFPVIEASAYFKKSLPGLFYTSYGLITLYTFFMAFAVFINPRLFKWFLIKITSLPFLRRWRYDAYERGNEILWASEQLRGKKPMYWVRISLLTIFIWSSRYLLVNCLADAFVDLNLFQHILIFGRHIILWIVMLISPTPGSSGTAEYFFPVFFGSFLNDYVIGTVIIWRLATYYLYLLLGVIFLPRWVRRVFFKKQEKSGEEKEAN